MDRTHLEPAWHLAVGRGAMEEQFIAKLAILRLI